MYQNRYLHTDLVKAIFALNNWLAALPFAARKIGESNRGAALCYRLLRKGADGKPGCGVIGINSQSELYGIAARPRMASSDSLYFAVSLRS